MRTVQHVLDMEPRFVFAHIVLGSILIANGRYDDAIATMERCATLSGRGGLPLSLLAHAYGKVGRTEEFARVFGELEATAAGRFLSPLHLSLALAGAGRIDEAIAHLDAALEQRDSFFASIHFAPLCDPLRGHPGFGAALKRIGAA